MFRANIYSMEPLTPVAREAVNDGIGMVAAYMGETVSTRELLVRLPMTQRGTVNAKRVGYGNLDKLVELHLMAVPLDKGEGEAIGLAGLGRGWSFVDTMHGAADVMRTTSAHEVAHGLGFVIASSEQADPKSPNHCCDGNCIMHKKVTILMSESGTGQQTPPSGSASLYGQYDFCLPCKIDLRSKGAHRLAELRRSRLFSRRGIK